MKKKTTKISFLYKAIDNPETLENFHFYVPHRTLTDKETSSFFWEIHNKLFEKVFNKPSLPVLKFICTKVIPILFQPPLLRQSFQIGLEEACKIGNKDMVDFLLFSPDLPYHPNPFEQSTNSTPLATSINYNHNWLVPYFFEQAKNQNFKSKYYHEAFRVAVFQGDVQTLKYLVNKSKELKKEYFGFGKLDCYYFVGNRISANDTKTLDFILPFFDKKFIENCIESSKTSAYLNIYYQKLTSLEEKKSLNETLTIKKSSKRIKL